MLKDYDFLCGNDFTCVKVALRNDNYHTISVQAKLAKTIDFSGGLKNIDEIIIKKSPKFTRILWSNNAQSIRRLKIGSNSNLASLDLSALVNLEELSIINCKKLKEIKGLSKHLRFLNIQGCKLNQLNLSSCKKIKNFILTTLNESLTIHFNHCEELESVVINVEGNNENSGKVDCVFDNCTQLNSLKIKSLNVPTKVTISGGDSLDAGLFLLGEGGRITGATSYAGVDFDNKLQEVEEYTLKNLKNALEIPQNPDDIETIIQENGLIKNKTKACLVKLNLLMSPQRSDYLIESNKYSNLDVDLPNSIQDSKESSIIDPVHKVNYKRVLITKFSFNNFTAISQKNQIYSERSFSSIWLFSKTNFNLKLDQKNNNSLKLATNYFEKQLNYTNYFLSKVNGYPLEFTKDAKSIYIKELLAVYKPTISKRIEPRIGINKEKTNTLFYPKALSGTTKSILKFFGMKQAHAPYKGKENLTNNKYLSSQQGLPNALKAKVGPTHLAAGPDLHSLEMENNALSLDVKEKFPSHAPSPDVRQAEPRLADGALASLEDKKNPLSNLDLRENFPSEGPLKEGNKANTKQRPLSSDPHFVAPHNEGSFLHALDLKEKPLSQGNLIKAKKSKAQAEYLKANPVLCANKIESSNLLQLEINEDLSTQNDVGLKDFEDLTIKFHVARALVDLKPRSNLPIDEFCLQLVFNINEQISKCIKQELQAQDKLTGAEKVKAEGKHLEAYPQLTSYENQASSILALNINENLQSEVDWDLPLENLHNAA
ncbi:MAG: hypothetical protein H0U73_12395, partial [Tatlockia sp.]|nr:hypothetical protein [Tatlockia sp.]